MGKKINKSQLGKLMMNDFEILLKKIVVMVTTLIMFL